MRRLHDYVPCIDGKLKAVPCHGDGLSVERMNDCQRHSSCLDTPTERLEGLVAVPQDFHRRMILLQVILYQFGGLLIVKDYVF